MGCSPSKGSPWNDTKGPIIESGVLVTGPVEPSNKLESDNRSSSSESQTENDEGDRTFMIQNDASIDLQEGKKLPVSKIATEVDTVIAKVRSQQVEASEVPQEKQEYDLHMAESQGQAVGRRPRRSKGIRQTTQKDKEKKASINEQKVDLPEYMVKAHQAAYAYLNPSISKYEALLGLLDQAARTQLSLQPMVAFMLQRYEEVTHSLEEMATEGEEILREQRDHLTWPSPMMDHNFTASVKPENQAPDLMQQLLQYSTERMHQVQDSTGGLGDSALEEASDYYLSLSKLLDQKLKAKKMAEGRLSQVIAHIEVAALQKFNPEDSALQSEDSGIGADNESLAGSEKHQRRRESCEPAGTTGVKATGCHHDTPSSVKRGENASRQVGKVSTRPSLNILELLFTGKDQTGAHYPQGSEDEDENDAEDDEEGEKKSGQRSNSLPTDPSQFIHCLKTTHTENPQNIELPFKMKDTISGHSCFLPSQQSALSSRKVDRTGVGSPPWREEDDWKARRPQTASASLNDKRQMPLAGRQQRSQSMDSKHNQVKDCTLHQPEKRQRELSCHMERMSKGEVGVEAKETAILNVRRGASVDVRKLLNPQVAVSNRLRSSLDRNFNILPSHERTGPKEVSSRAQRVEREEKVEGKAKERMNGRGQLRASILPSPPALSEAEPPKMCRGRNSVKRLINTFSQKNDEQHQGSSNVQGSLRNTRTCGAPTTLSTGSGNAVLIINGNNDNSCPVAAKAANRPEDLNVDSLPPPPPEVLMDNSFESASRLFVSEGGARISSMGQSPVPGGSEVTQRLPSHGDLPHSSLSLSPVCSVRQDGEVGYQNEEAAFQLDSDQKSKEAATQYQQARKFTPLSHATDSPLRKAPVKMEPKTASVSIGNNASSVVKSTSPYPLNIKPPTTPPVSRARMPPSTLSNWKSPHNPPLWSQPNPQAHSNLPSSPPGQQRLLSPLKLRQEETWGSTCSLTAKCPPPSLLVERWARPSSPPQPFNDIHSTFENTVPSPSEPAKTWATFGSCAPPQPKGTATCKLPVSMRGPQPFVKQNHSEHHPSTTPPSKRPERPIATMNQSCGNGPDISN